MDPAIVGIGASLAALFVARRKSSGYKVSDIVKETVWKKGKELPYNLGVDVETVTGWTDLPDYLSAVAWTESRFNPEACNGECGSNSARGLFQLRPKSAFNKPGYEHLVSEPNLLFDPRINTAFYTWYMYRLRPFASKNQTIDWLALRRGAAFPSLVSDVNEGKPRSIDTRKRFEQALEAVGLPKSFMYQKAFPNDFEWPGVDVVLESVGVDPLDLK